MVRIDDHNPSSSIGPPDETGRLRFAVPGKGDVAEFLNYIEDMSILLGCPRCRSFSVKEIMLSGTRLQVCEDCGYTVMVPPAN
jgi:hypothetical protein